MKKLLLAAALLLTLATAMTSCGASRKTGCPAMAQ
jgi:predicted small lipoprotein YifL